MPCDRGCRPSPRLDPSCAAAARRIARIATLLRGAFGRAALGSSPARMRAASMADWGLNTTAGSFGGSTANL